MLQIEDPADLIVVMMGLFKFRPKPGDRDLMCANSCWDFMSDVTFYPFFEHELIEQYQFDEVKYAMTRQGFDTTFEGPRMGPLDREMSVRSIKFARRPA